MTTIINKLIFNFRHLKSLKGCTRLPRQWFTSYISDFLIFISLFMWNQSQRLYPNHFGKINHYCFNPNQDLKLRVTTIIDKLNFNFRHLKSLKGCTRLPWQWFSLYICDLLLFLPLFMWDQSQGLYPNLSSKINHYPFNPNQDPGMWDQSQWLYPNLSRKINHYPFNPNQDPGILHQPLT